MSFVQKYDILIVLDETQLDFAIFVFPKHRHFIFGFFDVAIDLEQRVTKQTEI